MTPHDRAALERALDQGRLIPCVGPDLSRAAGRVTPLELARRLAAQLREVDPGGDASEVERMLELGHDDRALGVLRRRFGRADFVQRVQGILDTADAKMPELARLIAGVAEQLHAVYTTNLDRTLELAFGNGWWSAATALPGLAGRPRTIVKLCGTASQPDTWVLTSREYEAAYGTATDRRATLDAAYRSYTMVFVGFEQGPEVLRRLLASLAPAHAGERPPEHFLATDLTRWQPEARREFEERGVRLVAESEVLALLRERAGEGPREDHEASRRLPVQASPYPGLEPYTEALADFFHGRDDELARAVGLLRMQRWLSVEGPSGVGKSSFVRAGLVRAIERGYLEGRSGWKVVVLRPGKRPLLNLAEELGRVLGIAGVDGLVERLGHERGLSAVLREHVAKGEGVLLVVDQLEELLTFSDERERAAFGDALADAVADVEGPAYLVTTLRSDFVAEFTAGEHALARSFGPGAAHHVLRAMTREELREVVERPAKTLGVTFEPRLSERMLQDAMTVDASEPRRRVHEGTLPLVAHLLRGLWESQRDGELTLEAYERLGGIGGALTRSADRVLDTLASEERARAKEVLLLLVHANPEGRDTRQTRTRGEVLEKAGGGEAGRRLLQHLSGNAAVEGPERRVLVRLVMVEESRVDLVHEALTTEWLTMRLWLKDRRKAMVARDDLARAVLRWEAQKRPWLGLPGGAEMKWMLTVVGENDAQRAYQRRLRTMRWLRGGLVASAVTALSLTTLFALDSSKRARASQAEAEHRLEQATDLAQTVAITIDQRLRTVAGTVEVRRELLRLTQALLDELREGEEGNTSVLRARMTANLAAGDVAFRYDDLETARTEYEAALALARRLVALKHPGARRDLSVSLTNLGDVEMAASRLGEARARFDEALALDRALVEADPSNAQARRGLSVSLERLADVEIVVGRLDEARARFDEALALRRVIVETDPSNAEARRDLSVSLTNLGDVEMKAGRLDEARARFDEALALDRAQVEADPSNAQGRRDLSVSLTNLGDVEMKAGRLDQARARFDEALALHRVQVEADPSNTQGRRDLSFSLLRLGEVEMRAGRLDEARARFDEALALDRALVEADPSNTLVRLDIASSLGKLGDVEMVAGRLGEARAHFDEALALQRALVEADLSNAQARNNLSVALERLGDVEMQAGRLDEARARFDEALALRRALVEADPSNTLVRRNLSVSLSKLGGVEIRAGRLDEARARFDEALALDRAQVEADPSNAQARRDLSVSLSKLGDVEMKAGRLDEARARFDEALALHRAQVEAEPSNAQARRDLSVSLNKLGDVEMKAGRLDEARARFDEALALHRAQVEAEPSNAQARRDLGVSLERLGDVEMKAGRLDEARARFGEALALRRAQVEAEPSNAEAQFDLVLSHMKMLLVTAQREDEASALEHLTAADQLLDVMEAKGQLDGFAQRLTVREYVNQLTNTPTGETRITTATAQVVTGQTDIPPSTSCHLRVTHLPDNDPTCRATLACGDVVLYGVPSNTGWSPCTWADDLRWSDERPDDGDPALVFDTRAGTFAIWDDAYRIEGRIIP